MKTIKNIIKKRGYVEVIVDEDIIVFDDEIIMKYKMKIGDSFEPIIWKNIREENDFNIYYQLAIKKLKKMMTTHEIKGFLESKGASSRTITEIVKKLKSKKYLDDELYLKTYISMKKGVYGPRKLNYELRQKGIPFEWIEQAIQKIDEQSIIFELVQKKLASLKHKSNLQKKLNLKTYLLSKGFSQEAIDHQLNQLVFDDSNELANLKKDYEKLCDKFNHLQGYEKEQKILSKLFQKGYALSEIKKIMSS